MFQEITIIGNAGNDPQVNKTKTGKDVANFSVAVNEKFGETEKTTWFKVVAWDKLATKVVAPHIKSGQQVFVKGRVEIDTWTDQSGQTRAGMTITAQTIRLTGSKSE